MCVMAYPMSCFYCVASVSLGVFSVYLIFINFRRWRQKEQQARFGKADSGSWRKCRPESDGWQDVLRHFAEEDASYPEHH